MRNRFLLLAVVAIALSGCDSFEANKATSEPAAPSSITVAGIAEQISSGNFGQAVEQAKRLTAAEPDNAEAYLLLARGEARLQNAGNAVAALQTAFAKGFHDPRGALDHPDFDSLRGNSAFIALARRHDRSRPLPTVRRAPVETSVIRAGDVSITETSDGHSSIRAGDVVIED